MVVEILIETPSVPSCWIDMQGGWHVVAVAGQIIVHSIGGQYGMVVIAQRDKGSWCHAGHALVATVGSGLLFGGHPSEVVLHGALVGEGRIHGDDGIEEQLEVGGGITLCLGGDGGSQMPAG